jgi:hypothetical protein
MIALTLLIAGTGCQSQTPEPRGGAVTTRNAQMPDLPKDEDAAKAVVRKMLMDEALVLLKASGLRYTAAQFDVPIAHDDDKAQIGELSIQFQPCSDAQVKAMTDTIWAHGWQKGSVSHAVNVRKGPFYLSWGAGFDGCRFEMTTVNISQHLRMTDDTTTVPELEGFKTRP